MWEETTRNRLEEATTTGGAPVIGRWRPPIGAHTDIGNGFKGFKRIKKAHEEWNSQEMWGTGNRLDVFHFTRAQGFSQVQ
jgi:hypothetical protein